jgi:hypothetical protein
MVGVPFRAHKTNVHRSDPVGMESGLSGYEASRFTSIAVGRPAEIGYFNRLKISRACSIHGAFPSDVKDETKASNMPASDIRRSCSRIAILNSPLCFSVRIESISRTARQGASIRYYSSPARIVLRVTVSLEKDALGLPRLLSPTYHKEMPATYDRDPRREC